MTSEIEGKIWHYSSTVLLSALCVRALLAGFAVEARDIVSLKA